MLLQFGSCVCAFSVVQPVCGYECGVSVHDSVCGLQCVKCVLCGRLMAVCFPCDFVCVL